MRSSTLAILELFVLICVPIHSVFIKYIMYWSIGVVHSGLYLNQVDSIFSTNQQRGDFITGLAFIFAVINNIGTGLITCVHTEEPIVYYYMLCPMLIVTAHVISAC